jgi:uncharacterized UBP type Zn finger protein
LLTYEEQQSHALKNIKKRQLYIKNYFNKREKSTTFVTEEKVLLWDFVHPDKDKHTKFHNFLLGPYIIASNVGNNSYLMKGMDGRLFSYTTNGSHLKHYVEPG